MKKFGIIAILLGSILLVSCSHDGKSADAGGKFRIYADSAVEVAQDSGEPYAVFWASKSCATCGKKEGELKAMNDDLPGKVFRLEFDESSDEMKDKYGVVKYDTFTVFDGKGGHTTMKGASVDEVVAKLKA